MEHQPVWRRLKDLTRFRVVLGAGGGFKIQNHNHSGRRGFMLLEEFQGPKPQPLWKGFRLLEKI